MLVKIIDYNYNTHTFKVQKISNIENNDAPETFYVDLFVDASFDEANLYGLSNYEVHKKIISLFGKTVDIKKIYPSSYVGSDIKFKNEHEHNIFIKNINYEDTVICSSCNSDYSDSIDHGGFINLLNGDFICPKCSFILKKFLHPDDILECQKNLSFREFIISKRGIKI